MFINDQNSLLLRFGKEIAYSDFYSYSGTQFASITNASNAYASSNNNTYAQISLTTGGNAQTYVYYNFNLNIPSNAIIYNVIVRAKGNISTSNTSYVQTAQMELARQSTHSSLLSNIKLLTTSPVEQIFDTHNISWTPEILNDLCVMYAARRGGSNTTKGYYLSAYGGTVSVMYSLP